MGFNNVTLTNVDVLLACGLCTIDFFLKMRLYNRETQLIYSASESSDLTIIIIITAFV